MPEKRKQTTRAPDPTNNRESLGWLAQSSVQPKKRKEIEGVGVSSLVALQATLAKKQQEATLIKDGKLDAEELKKRRKGRIAALVEKKNPGVDKRDTRDKKHVQKDKGDNKLTESRLALERKAKLYEQLASGAAVDKDEKYEVDFLMKPALPRPPSPPSNLIQPKTAHTHTNHQQQPPSHQHQQHWHTQTHPTEPTAPLQYQGIDTTGLAVHSHTGGLISSDMQKERNRRQWHDDVHNTMAAEEIYEAQREERIDLVEQIESETRAGRKRAESARQQRVEGEAAKRQRLKELFLKKKLEQLKAAAKK